jgi:hypothetical protein
VSAPARTPCTRDTPKCNYAIFGPGTTLPACCTEHLLEVLEYVGNLLEQHGITYWLDYGTLLGAVRHRDLIPWDGDADLGILEDDVERVAALVPVIERDGYSLDQSHPAVLRIHYSPVNHRHVDLIPWRDEDGVLHDRHAPDDQWPGMSGSAAFPRRFIEELTTLPVHGRLYPAPAHYDEFLRVHRYGPHYMTPTREIVDSDLKSKLGAAEMTADPELLDRVATGNERLLELIVEHSRLVRRGIGTPGSGKWKVIAGLPLDPAPDHVARARERVAATQVEGDAEPLVWALAWVEQAVAEYEDPPSFIRARRLGRRFQWLVRGFVRRHAEHARQQRAVEPIRSG